MGCLCSSKLEFSKQFITRRATYTSNADLAGSSFQGYSENRNFYSEYSLHSNLIGSGLFGEIRLCTQNLTKKTFAVKIILKANLPPCVLKKRLIEFQVKIIRELDHPSILKVYEFFEDPCNYYLIMEHIKGGDLYTKIFNTKKITEKHAAKIMKQILSGLAHIHSKNIVHRDMKLENILIEENNDEFVVKLIDFDTATKFGKSGMKGIFGTVYYMAPELISGTYTEKCDVWSAGVILYSMLTKNFPFGGTNDKEIMQNITKSKLDLKFLRSKRVSSEAINLIQKLMHPDPKERVSASEASNHPWIVKHTQSTKMPEPIAFDRPNFQTSLSQALRLWALINIIPSNELADYHRAFIQIDKNFDGVLSKNELLDYFGGYDNTETLMEIGDWNDNGVLEYYEFMSVIVEGSVILKYIDKIFEVLDKHRSDKFALSELVFFLESQLNGGVNLYDESQELGRELTKEDIVQLIDI